MKTIGIDLDGTIARYEKWISPEVLGDPHPEALQFLKALKADKWYIVVYTTRADYIALQYLAANGLSDYVDSINVSPYPTDSLKQSFDVYIGDEALRFQGSFIDLLPKINKGRHWNEEGDTFERDALWSNRNPEVYLRGVGKLFVDAFEDKYLALWEGHCAPAPIALLTICSHAKPYSKSYIHAAIRERLFHGGVLDKVDYIHISNAGIIPHEAGIQMPFCAYDWNGVESSQEITDYHKKVMALRLDRWFKEHSHKYQGVIVYLREGGNTYNVAVSVAPPSTKIIGAAPLSKPLPWMLHSDADDCLVLLENVSLVFTAVKEFLK